MSPYIQGLLNETLAKILYVVKHTNTILKEEFYYDDIS